MCQPSDDAPAHGVDLTLVGTEEMLRELSRRFDGSVVALYNAERREAGRVVTPEETAMSWHGGQVVVAGLLKLLTRKQARQSGW